jgi:hypothetical protein
MSYSSRQKKREYRRAERAASVSQTAQRRDHPDRWYLTIVRKENYCASCTGFLRKGADMVFRKKPTEMLCVSCADRRSIKYRPSRGWDQRERKRRGRRSRTAIADLSTERGSSPQDPAPGSAQEFARDLVARWHEKSSTSQT